MTKIKDVAMVKFQSLSIVVRTTTKISQMVTEIFYAIDKWFPLGAFATWELRYYYS